MFIHYRNGMRIEGTILRRTQTKMRVAVKDGDDVLEFARMNGVWVSEDLEPVKLRFERESFETAAEDDYICSKELASMLSHFLRDDGGGEAAF